MSEQTGESRKSIPANNLPQFMNEEPNYTNIEDTQSWLNNNLHRLMIGVSIVWFAVVLIYITQFFGWSNLFLMMPDEFGGFLAGITLPLAIIWVVMAYIDRGTSFKQEAKFLRAYLNQLVYPEDGAPQTAKAMADAIRSQVVELQQATKMATEQTALIKDGIKSNIEDFSKLIGTLDTYSSKTIVELSEGVKFLLKNFESISGKAEASAETFSGLNRQFISEAGEIESSMNNLFDKLLPGLKEIKTSAELLNAITSASNNDIVRANEMLLKFNEEAGNNLSKVAEALEGQTNMLQKVSQSAIENCNMIKKSLASEINDLGNAVDAHSAKLEQTLASSNNIMRSKIDELSKHATDNLNIINNNIAKGLDGLDSSVDAQIKKVDTSLSKHNHEILEFMSSLDQRADGVIQKFAKHGENIAQEIDRLMVRSSNLEESIATQVSNLNNVSQQASDAMQRVENSMALSANAIAEKSAAANDDIVSYIDTLQEKTGDLERIGSDVIDKAAAAGSELLARHKHINDTIANVSLQVSALNENIKNSAEHIKIQADSSILDINNVAENMNKYATSLTEASSIVVAQSQISEASLAQQQKNITNSVNKVEEIKAELKRQIEELSAVASTLENDAAVAVEKLKSNLGIMMTSCNEVINKSKTINDNLLEQSNLFDDSANRTLAKVTQFENTLTTQSQNMDVLSQSIADRANMVDSILERQIKAVNDVTSSSQDSLNQSVSSFENQSQSLNAISKAAAGYVADVAQSLDDKASALHVLFKRQESEFYNLCDKIADNTETMSEALKKQIAVIEQSADKVFSRMVMLEEDTSRHTESVVNNSHRSIDRLAEIEELISAKNAAVNKMVTEITNNFNGIANRIQENITRFTNTVKQVKDDSTAASKGILDNCSKLSSVQTELSKETSNVVKLLDEHIKNIDVSIIKTKTQSDDIGKVLSEQKENLTEVVNTLATQARLGEASLAQQYKYLSDATNDVAQKMKEINESFKNSTGDIFEASTKFAYEFDVLGDRMIKAGEDIAKVSKSSMKSLEQVNLSLSQYSEDLDAAIHHSVDNLGGVFKDYEKYIAGFNTVTAETSSGVYEINSLISAQSDKMVKISEDTRKLVDCFNTVLNDTSNQLSERANLAYDKVKALGQDLKNLGLQMEEATKISAAHFENSGDKLRASISEAAANAERISNEILSSGEVFVKQSNVLVATADETINKVNLVMKDLVSTGQDFANKGDSIVKQSVQFTEVVGNQAKLLNEQAKKADDAFKKLSSGYHGMKIDDFLKNAATIIEKLQNISVDINRVFNPKEEEDLWKKYYNGDSGVFVRHLAKNLSKQQIAAVRKEYEKNAEFRNLISSYLSEFEVLISQAQTHEHSGVLLSVISGADIGKLYYILAKTLDKLN